MFGEIFSLRRSFVLAAPTKMEVDTALERNILKSSILKVLLPLLKDTAVPVA
jgi:hypothetical protein